MEIYLAISNTLAQTLLQVSRFLETPELQLGPTATLSASQQLVDPSIKQRLLRHIESCVSEIDLDFSLATMRTLDPETDQRLDRLEEMLMGGQRLQVVINCYHCQFSPVITVLQGSCFNNY